MPCYHPIDGYAAQRSDDLPNGGFTASRKNAHIDIGMKVPCGQCIGCRLERSRQWAIRCVHENQMHDESCFVTLTYDDDNLPKGETLVREHCQLFFKRLRKKTPRIRLFYCGEYGDESKRPHYHALIFGWRPTDGKQLTNDDPPLYESKKLTETWGMGLCSFGDITFESAAYTARYCTKKITGDKARDHYSTVDPETGEITERTPEFMGCSQRPAIGIPFLEKYGRDIYEKDQVILRGKPMRPPRAYDKWAADNLPTLWENVRRSRFERTLERHPVNQNPDEFYETSWLRFKARIKIAHAKMKKRNEQR